MLAIVATNGLGFESAHRCQVNQRDLGRQWRPEGCARVSIWGPPAPRRTMVLPAWILMGPFHSCQLHALRN